MTFIAALLYVYFVMYFVALGLLPFMAVGIPIAFLVAVFVSRRRPLIVFFRRFGNPHHQLFIMGKVMPELSAFGRMVWLDDQRAGKWRPNKVRHPTPVAFYAFLVMAGHVVWALVVMKNLPLTWGAAAGAYVAVGGWILLESLVGSRVWPAFAFFAGTLVLLSTQSGLAAARTLQVDTPQLAWPALLILLALSIIALRSRTAVVDRDRRVRALGREATSSFYLFPRFILSSPALAMYVSCGPDHWRPAVRELLRAGRLAVMDVSDLSLGSASSPNLRWELSTAQQEECGILLLAEEQKLASSESAIREALAAEGLAKDVRILPYTKDGAVGSLFAVAHGLVMKRSR